MAFTARLMHSCCAPTFFLSAVYFSALTQCFEMANRISSHQSCLLAVLIIQVHPLIDLLTSVTSLVDMTCLD